LIGHLEGKYLRLHLKIHPNNRTTKQKAWRVKVKGKEELFALATQGIVVFQLTIVAKNVLYSHEMDSNVMPKSNPTHLLSSIL
jgi:hypothetical protein